MSIKSTAVFTRPNSSVPWYHETYEFQELYLQTGNVTAEFIDDELTVLPTAEVSSDGCTITWSMEFPSIEQYFDFKNSTSTWDIASFEYNEQAGIRIGKIDFIGSGQLTPVRCVITYTFDNMYYKNLFFNDYHEKFNNIHVTSISNAVIATIEGPPIEWLTQLVDKKLIETHQYRPTNINYRIEAL
jgi:hypothetical protein